MDERNVNNIRKHLEDENAQRRVQNDILRAREDVTVTIGRAAQLFNFSESQLRDWESRGFLKPQRSKDDRGQRLYALSELDKLALLKELLMQGGYALSNIPKDVDEIWHSVSPTLEEQAYKLNGSDVQREQNGGERYSIDHLVEEANKGEHWRYFISQVLRTALNLICEDVPDTVAGIILPLRRTENAVNELNSQKIAELGECLIGWRDQNRTFYTFYSAEPYFDYPSDFRVRGLRTLDTEEEPKDATFIVLQRKTRTLFPSLEIIETIRQLLVPIYEDIDIWLPYFDKGIRYTLDPTTALGSASNPESMLKFLADMVVRIGGKNDKGEDCWKFCCVLLPNNILLPFQLRTLLVQAQSANSPHVVGKTVVSPETPILSLSLRAFQSGHVVYRPHVSLEDQTIVYRALESLDSPVESAIAFPIGAERSVPIGILYVVSKERDAFSITQQRVLRLITRMTEELLGIVSIRQKSEEGLRDTIKRPRVVNQTLEGFASENRFSKDIETLLQEIRETKNPLVEGETSFISIDIDNQSTYTGMYGNQMSINLSKALGDRIKGQMGVLLGKRTDYQIYHIYADRFFLLLNGRKLDTAREYAEKLQQALRGNYLVSIMPKSFEQPRDRIEIRDVTVRLGVTSYKHTKLYEVLQRYPIETQIVDMGFSIFYFLEEALNRGKQEGGNCIISWYPADREHSHGRLDVWPSKV